MIRPDWKKFSAKFSENPQYNFEWLCYLLFCEEFNKPFGIFRYRNQSAIETNPIIIDGNEIGFQAKFYDTALSKHKNELLETLTKAKRDYPNIKILRFYSNQEWSQAYKQKPHKSKAIKPLGQVEIENKAAELGIDVQWYTSSYFESKFVTQDCEFIIKNFFKENSIFDFIEKQEHHTSTILSGINSKMSYGDKSFSLGRNQILEQLKTNTSQVSILSGLGGVGKTVEIKNLYEELKEIIPFFVFKAVEFELNRLEDLCKEGSIYEFASSFEDSEKKIIVIDSAEKLLDLKNPEPSKEFIALMLKKDWQIIFTTRDYYFDDLNFFCMEMYRLNPLKIYINKLDSEDLIQLSEKYNFILPNDNKLLDLLRTPLYLSEYLSFVNEKQVLEYANFKCLLWETKIKRGNIKREQTFISLALKRANEGCFFLKPDKEDIETAVLLSKDEVLCYDNASFYITHDIYEEWALEKFINSEFANGLPISVFFERIGKSLSVRRSFRSWVTEKLLLNDEGIKVFLEKLMEDGELENFWRDEILVSILLSDYSETFFKNFEHELLQPGFELIKRICFLLRIACKEVDDTFFKQLGLTYNETPNYNYIITKPKGKGWNFFIKFLYENVEQFSFENIGLVLLVVFEWNSKFKEGETTRYSSLIALKYYQWTQKNDIDHYNYRTELLQTIVYGASEIRENLSLLINEVVQNKYIKDKDPYSGLSKFILTKIDGLNFAKILATETIELANVFWLRDYTSYESYSSRNAERRYGITDDYDLNYHPESAYQTPIFCLLRIKQKEIITFDREKLIIPLSPKQLTYQSCKLGDFSEINKAWSIKHSETTHQELQKNPEDWFYYHTLYSEQRKTWQEIPYMEIAKRITRPEFIVADLGCGENLLKKEIPNEVLSFDHVSIDDSVIACDISNLPLDDHQVDVAVLSLSLMGSNSNSYIIEAYRILKNMGFIIVAEPKKKWLGKVDVLTQLLCDSGFTQAIITETEQFVYLQSFKI